MNRSLIQNSITERWPRWLGEWFLLFVTLLLAIWMATQLPEAPQLILLLLLYIITVNFSLPPSHGAAGLTPVVAVSSLLVVGVETAVALAAISFIVAELARPLWWPAWDYVNLPRPSLWERLSLAVVHVISLVVSGLIYRQTGGQAPLVTANLIHAIPLIGLTLTYGTVYFLLVTFVWLRAGSFWEAFFPDTALTLLSTAFLAQPFAIFGAITYIASGLPVFVIFCVGVMIFSIVIWLSWRRRFILEQQLAQFATLNTVSSSLRATLDLNEVLVRICHQLTNLIEAERLFIALIDKDGSWQQPVVMQKAGGISTLTEVGTTAAPFVPDDFTRWVAEHERMLNLDSRTMHFAGRHDLQVPVPCPTAWLGVPLMTAERTIGVIVLERLTVPQSFNRWNQEVLLAIAGQAGAAVQNARLHSEVVRLYNLTDEALARRVEQLQALLYTVQEGVLMIDMDGRTVLVNPMAADLLGQPLSSLHNQPLDWTQSAPMLGYEVDDLEELLSRLASGRAYESSRVIFEAPPAANGHGRRFIERTEAPVLAADGRVMGWLMTMRDVTEERELVEQRADLTRMIVHDLRNPLTTSISAIDLAKGQLAQEQLAGANEALDHARSSCLDMLDMVDSLMDIYRIEAGQFIVEADAMRLPLLAEQVVNRLQPLAQQKEIRLRLSCEPDVPAVWADEELIRRVLINLLDNALKFTPAGGNIEILLQRESAAGGHEPGARCTVRDTGPGIPAPFWERIFDRFMRTNQGGAQVRGTGLGLTFCKLVVEAHGGRIWAEDGPEGGSCFIFTLPGIPLF